MLVRSAAVEVEVLYPRSLLPADRETLCVWAGRMRGEQHRGGKAAAPSAELPDWISERFLFPTTGHAYAFVGYTDYCLTNWHCGAGERFQILWQGETRSGQVRASTRPSLSGRGD